MSHKSFTCLLQLLLVLNGAIIDAYSIIASFLSICTVILSFAQFLFTVYTYLRMRRYVCMSVCCCSCPSDEADVDFNVISMDEFISMDEVISTGVKETWV